MPDFRFEDLHLAPVAGVDEAGRGPWAGPILAAAVVLDRATVLVGLDDSKKLSPGRRQELFEALTTSAKIGIGRASVEEIDRLNVLRANDLAMARAVAALPSAPASVLVDGNRIPPGLEQPARAVTKGDALSLSIAAASIVAKVTRDAVMAELAVAHPGYGWERNQGYGTAAHRAALARLGVTRHHRRSFRPIREMMAE